MINNTLDIKFTLVSTVFNEAKRLHQSIADIEAQTLLPDEIIIVDAGSGDGTLDILHEWKNTSKVNIKIIVEKGCNVARGRNIAIRAASHKMIVSTDFGCRFYPEWIESLVEPFRDPSVEVVGGAFTVKEDEVQTLAARADYVLQRGYEISMDKFFSVSSRSIAYKKYVWEQLNGYPEWLTLAADDTIFWKLVKKAGFNYVFVDKPYVYWMRHKTFRAFGREDFRYGLGDGESGINKRNVISKIIETSIRYSLFINLIILLLMGYNFILLCLIPVQLAGLRSYLSAFRRWTRFRNSKYGFKVLAATFLLTEIARINYIKGYLKGYFSKTELKKRESHLLQEKLT
jgi:glycosyltransferase involved in cell wall biosynthesis